MKNHGLLTIILVCFLSGFSLCYASEKKPDWIDNPATKYEPSKYLTGLGYGKSIESASKMAHASLAKIFSANITYSSTDKESYSSVNGKGVYESINLSQEVNVTTDKVLENVKISERFFDKTESIHYALATMNKYETTTILKNKTDQLQKEADIFLSFAKQPGSKLDHIRNLYKALARFSMQEHYYADLQILSPETSRHHSGKVVETANSLSGFLANEVLVSVSAPEELKGVVINILNKHGITVSTDNNNADFRFDVSVVSNPVNNMNPQWKFIKWDADFRFMDKMSGEIIASMSISGRDGHLTLENAKNKMYRKIEKKVAEEIAPKILSMFFEGTVGIQ